MLKAKCVGCSRDKATFLFTGKTPEVNEYYHLELQTGKSLELNGLFHAIIPEFYYWMLTNDQFIFEDDNAILDFRCANRYELKDILKQKYGEGNVYKYSDKNHKLKGEPLWENVPDYVKEDYNNGNKERIQLVLKSWGDYSPKQAGLLVDIIFKIMDKLGVNTLKYNNIKGYLEKKEIDILNEKNRSYTEKVKNKFKGEIID